MTAPLFDVKAKFSEYVTMAAIFLTKKIPAGNFLPGSIFTLVKYAAYSALSSFMQSESTRAITNTTATQFPLNTV